MEHRREEPAADATERRYLTSPQVGRRYKVGPMTLYRWRKDPDLGFPQPYWFGTGRALRYDEAELDAFDARRREATRRRDAARLPKDAA
jgi:predicted DNA-binding transcriptional regulator AlpA